MPDSRHSTIRGTRWVVLTTLDLHVQVPKLGATRELIQQFKIGDPGAGVGVITGIQLTFLVHLRDIPSARENQFSLCNM